MKRKGLVKAVILASPENGVVFGIDIYKDAQSACLGGGKKKDEAVAVTESNLVTPSTKVSPLSVVLHISIRASMDTIVHEVRHVVDFMMQASRQRMSMLDRMERAAEMTEFVHSVVVYCMKSPVGTQIPVRILRKMPRLVITRTTQKQIDEMIHGMRAS